MKARIAATQGACVFVARLRSRLGRRRELLGVDHAAQREQRVLEGERTARPFVRLRVETRT